MAENVVFENPIGGDCKELQNYNEYIKDKNYDAFLIDNALRGNSLTFTLMYIYHK
jgi:hypothetical protein